MHLADSNVRYSWTGHNADNAWSNHRGSPQGCNGCNWSNGASDHSGTEQARRWSWCRSRSRSSSRQTEESNEDALQQEKWKDQALIPTIYALCYLPA